MDSKTLKDVAVNKIIELFGLENYSDWKIDVDVFANDNLIQCERYKFPDVYFNLYYDGRIQVEIFLPSDGQILSYNFDNQSFAKMFYESHCDHLEGIRSFIKESI